PLARCALACAGDEAKEVTLASRPEDLEYALPPLTVLRLALESSTANPSHGRPGQLAAGVDGETVVLDGDDPADTIHSLNRLLQRYDPDIVLTEWGDSVLLPRLQDLAARTGIPLQLNRDPTHRARTRRSRSYMTYGQVVYQAGAQMLHGRWHIDLRNSFIYAESELGGLLEVARLARIPVQELARTSTGTAISSMQLHGPVRDGTLIPWQKSEPEAFKTASQLIVTDKGGLTYQPLVGLYEQAGELDFSSMYPTMMSTFNISPETIGCACCPDSRVPEINYTICRRRRGLVPQVLDHLLERRIYYKQRKQATIGSQRALYDQRQTALKWCLVTSFGYLGYRNARFGRIEAHEAVTAFAREMLLPAEEVAESQGFRMLHALVVQTQERMLQRMFRCQTLQDVRAALPELLGILEEALIRLRSKDVEAAELVITNTLSQEVGEYRHNTVQAITARTLDRHGAHLHPGEAVQFIITSAGAKVPEDRVRPYALLGSDWHYDLEAYATLLLRAAATVLELFGYSEERLREEVWPLLEQQ